jgi:hypothetical protein
MCLLGIIKYYFDSIRKYHNSSICLQNVARFSQVLSVSSGIIRYLEGLKKHLDGAVLIVDIPVLHTLGIVSLVLGTVSYCIRKSCLKIHEPILNRQ